MQAKIEVFILKFQESWILKRFINYKTMIEIIFKRHWTKITPFGNYSSRVESGLWFKKLNQLEIQKLNRVIDSRIESVYGSM